MVIPRTAPRRKGISQPEAVFFRQAIGNIGEAGRALVGRYHQIGIITVITHHLGRRYHRLSLTIVGDIQQAADKGLVTGNATLLPCLPVRGIATFDHKAALGTDRHDDGIFYHLRFYQAQHFGPEILTAVRPAQATTGDGPATQMNAFHLR